MGYGIWADGLGRVLDRLNQVLPGTPLLVAEYGIGTSDDSQHAAYLERGLQVTSDAIARGLDVRGSGISARCQSSMTPPSMCADSPERPRFMTAKYRGPRT